MDKQPKQAYINRPPIRYFRHYAERLGGLAINTAKVVQHEVFPPKSEPLPIPEIVLEEPKGEV